MSIYFDSYTTELSVAVCTILFAVYAYFRFSYTYWSRRNVSSVSPSLPFGNMADQFLLRKAPGEVFAELYNKLKAPGRRFAGFYMILRPAVLLLDPELIKDIMSRDFDHFHDRIIYSDEKNEPLSGHLLALKGSQWKNLRSKLTPTFTSGKMKNMFHTISACGDDIPILLDEHASDRKPVHIKELMGRFTTDVIGSCAFGVDCNSLKDPDAIFRQYGRKLFEPSVWDSLKIMFSNLFPRTFSVLGMKRVPNDATDFFVNLVKETVEYRQKNNVKRNDFMQLLIQLNEECNEGTEAGKSLTLLQMAAQAFVFFLAGFETSSTTMTFTLYDLALHHDIQDKVREEVQRVFKKYDGKLTYDGIMEMTYMDKVIQESQRLHSPIPQLIRVCTKDYKILDSDVVIKRGTPVVISVLGLQSDPEYYPQPNKYDPERFNAEEKVNRHPYTFLPFGEGPRQCIGMRFGLLETKVGLAMALKNHRFRLSPKTKTPLAFLPRNIIFSVKGDVWLDVEKI